MQTSRFHPISSVFALTELELRIPSGPKYIMSPSATKRLGFSAAKPTSASSCCKLLSPRKSRSIVALVAKINAAKIYWIAFFQHNDAVNKGQFCIIRHSKLQVCIWELDFARLVQISSASHGSRWPYLHRSNHSERPCRPPVCMHEYPYLDRASRNHNEITFKKCSNNRI